MLVLGGTASADLLIAAAASELEVVAGTAAGIAEGKPAQLRLLSFF